MLTKFKGLNFRNEAGVPMLPEPRGDVNTGAWFGSQALKQATVERMEKHRQQDEIIQGLYQAGLLTGDESEDGDVEFTGCLVGCTLPLFNTQWYDDMVQLAEDDWDTYGPLLGDESLWHLLIERFYNIPVSLAGLLDNTFEAQFEGDAPEFAVAALEAIPVGAIYTEDEIDFMRGDRTPEHFLEKLASPGQIVTVVPA